MTILSQLLAITVSVPEPTTLVLIATGLGGLAFEARRRRGRED